MFPIHSTELNAKLARGKHKTYPSFRTVSHFPMEYRKLEILHSYAMAIWGIYVVPFQAFALNFVLYANYVLIRNWDHLDFLMRCLVLLWTVSIQVFWYLVLHLAGRYYLFSQRNRGSWKFLGVRDAQEAKFMAKFKKSTRPLGIGQNGYFIIKPLSVVKFVKGVVRGTVRVLLTMR